MNNIVRDTVKNKDGSIYFTWHPGRILGDVKSFQVYGFCLNREGKVCLVRDKDETRFTLPGGHVDGKETPEEALKREFQEEAQFVPENIKVLGTLEVEVKDGDGVTSDHHQQVRFVCFVKEIPEFVEVKDGWETAERIFIDPQDLPKYIDWIAYPTGKAQFEEFLKILDK